MPHFKYLYKIPSLSCFFYYFFEKNNSDNTLFRASPILYRYYVSAIIKKHLTINLLSVHSTRQSWTIPRGPSPCNRWIVNVDEEFLPQIFTWCLTVVAVYSGNPCNSMRGIRVQKQACGNVKLQPTELGRWFFCVS